MPASETRARLRPTAAGTPGGVPPRVPSFAFVVGVPRSPTPTAFSAQPSLATLQPGLPPLPASFVPPGAVAAIRPPAASVAAPAKLLPVLVQPAPGLKPVPLVPAQSLASSPAAEAARAKRARGLGPVGLCRAWLFGGPSCGGEE